MFQRAWLSGAAREASSCCPSVEAAAVAGAPHAASAYFSASVIGAVSLPAASRSFQPIPSGGSAMRGADGAARQPAVAPAVEVPSDLATTARPSPGSRNPPFPIASHQNLHHPHHLGVTGFMAPSPRTPIRHAPAMQRIESGAQLNRTPSLQFAMEFDDEVQTAPKLDTVKVKMAIEQMWRLMACSQAEERKIQHIVIDSRDRCQAEGREWTCSDLAKILEGLGYNVCIRTALGGGEGADCLRNLRHNFLVVCLPGESAGTSFILDIDFKDQFAVASPTPHYSALIDNMDREFIGTEEKLRKVIHMLCEEMAAAFKEQEIGIPPWRQFASMLSKWCPRRSADFSASGERFHRPQTPPNAAMSGPLEDAFATAPVSAPLQWDARAQPQQPLPPAAVLASALQQPAAAGPPHSPP